MNRYCGHQERDGKKLGHYGIVKQLDQPTTEPVQQLTLCYYEPLTLVYHLSQFRLVCLQVELLYLIAP